MQVKVTLLKKLSNRLGHILNAPGILFSDMSIRFVGNRRAFGLLLKFWWVAHVNHRSLTTLASDDQLCGFFWDVAWIEHLSQILINWRASCLQKCAVWKKDKVCFSYRDESYFCKHVWFLQAHRCKLYKLLFLSKEANNKYKNWLTAKLRKAEHDYYIHFHDLPSDAKNYSKTIKNLMGTYKKQESDLSSGNDLNTSFLSAEDLNNFFSSIGNSLESQFPQVELRTIIKMWSEAPESESEVTR